MTLIRTFEDLSRNIMQDGGVALVIGDRGTGKTTLCQNLIDRGTENGIKCGYIDANVTENSLSGLGIMGLAVCTEPGNLMEKKPVKEYFVGSMTVIGHGIDIIFGISRLIKEAKKQGCKIILVDTAGEFDYSNSVIFSQNEIESLYPDYVIGLQSAHEIEFAICPFLRRDGMKIALLEKSPLAVYRQNLVDFGRKMSFAKLFDKNQCHTVLMGEVSFLNTWLGNGRQLKWQYLRTLANILSEEVFHVEIAYKTLFVFSNAKSDEKTVEEIKNYLHVSHVVIQPPDIYSNLYVGLESANNTYLGVGLIENINFAKNIMSVRSSILSVEPVKHIKFGFVKSAPTGDFISQV